ncbi:hypothetical protein [Paraburkholderia sp. J41]|uniref:hypothetical protein n=1 Tax=Paraburkholderia sp. J41 TaxID=2805433 RepID=UPI002AC33F0F|nr:hypothetical protein [Paraburkholderia sp. J41]
MSVLVGGFGGAWVPLHFHDARRARRVTSDFFARGCHIGAPPFVMKKATNAGGCRR